MAISDREKQILCLLCFTNKEIGKRLFVSENTVKAHIKNLKEKLFQNNRKSMMIKALKEKVIDIEQIVI